MGRAGLGPGGLFGGGISKDRAFGASSSRLATPVRWTMTAHPRCFLFRCRRVTGRSGRPAPSTVPRRSTARPWRRSSISSCAPISPAGRSSSGCSRGEERRPGRGWPAARTRPARFRRGRSPRGREPEAGPIASYRTGRRRCKLQNRGSRSPAIRPTTIREGRAEARHDQSGNVGGRGSTVPRFANPNRSARQAVPALRQAQGVLHALYLETAGQPGTAPRSLLPVPSRGPRRFKELRGPRRLDAPPSGSTARLVAPGDPRRRCSVRRTRHCRGPDGGSRRPRPGASRALPPPGRGAG